MGHTAKYKNDEFNSFYSVHRYHAINLKMLLRTEIRCIEHRTGFKRHILRPRVISVSMPSKVQPGINPHCTLVTSIFVNCILLFPCCGLDNTYIRTVSTISVAYLLLSDELNWINKYV